MESEADTAQRDLEDDDSDDSKKSPLLRPGSMGIIFSNKIKSGVDWIIW